MFLVYFDLWQNIRLEKLGDRVPQDALEKPVQSMRLQANILQE